MVCGGPAHADGWRNSANSPKVDGIEQKCATMENRRIRLEPNPDGWYCLGVAKDLRAGQVKSLTLMGEPLVVFRTTSGVASAMHAHCPHLGAHLGVGGCVEGEAIKCPFHHFSFSPAGDCVKTIYDRELPGKLRARVYPVKEIDGFLFAYYDRNGLAPRWEPPPADLAGCTPMLTRVFKLRGHPQETTENSVDLGHLMAVHGYENVEILSPLVTDGPYLHTHYRFERSAGPFGKPNEKLKVEIKIYVHGFGYSLVDVHVQPLGIRTLQWVLSTPTEAGKIELRIALRLKGIDDPKKISRGLALMPRKWVNAIFLWAGMRGYVHDVSQDFPMWENKIYVTPPMVAQGDGPIGRYRHWAKQFYPPIESAPAIEEELPVDAEPASL